LPPRFVPWKKKSTRKKVKRLAAPFVLQASLSADVIGIRAARNAGNNAAGDTHQDRPRAPFPTASDVALNPEGEPDL
jgi:hypothetical protein